MEYRLKGYQFWKQALPVPKEIQEKVYNKNLTMEEYLKYDLADKVPTEYIYWQDRPVVERFGAEKLKQLDFEMYNKNSYRYAGILMTISPDVSDLNQTFYQTIMDYSTGRLGSRGGIYVPILKPEDVTKTMLEKMGKYFVEDVDITQELKDKFYNGDLSIFDIVRNWHIFKEKDLKGKLEYESRSIDLEHLRKLMDEYPDIASIISYNETFQSLMSKLYDNVGTKEQRDEIVTEFCTELLNKEDAETIKEISSVIYTYVDPDEYLHERMDYLRFHKHENWEDYSYDYEEFAKGLDGMSIKDVLDAGFTMEVLLDSAVLDFVKVYGIKNIVEFDQECGHFFSRNNFEMLRIMQPMYMHYAGNNHDPNTTVYTRSYENYDRPYTKEEFYEAIRRMIIGGPSDWNYKGKGTDYRYITGLFRELNPDLFISDILSEEIQEAFYTKQLTPQMIIDNQDVIPELKGKKLASCFKYLNLTVITEKNQYGEYNNAYEYIEQKFGFDKAMEFIIKYGLMAEIVLGNYDRYQKSSYIDALKVNENDSFDDIIEKMIEKGRELVLKSKVVYSPVSFAPLKDKYPNLFISESAPQELQNLFYKRELKLEIIETHPEYIQYIQNIDLELLYKYMDVTVEVKTDDGIKQTRDNLMNVIKNVFGEQAFGVMLIYGKYLEQLYDNNKLSGMVISSNLGADDLLDTLDDCLYEGIVSGVIYQDEKYPTHFKNNYPRLFLPENTPEDIKNKYYNRRFVITDFIDNEELLQYFEETDIVYCLGASFKEMYGLFNNQTFLEIIKLCGEEIKNEAELFRYAKSKANGNISKVELCELIYEYICSRNNSLKYIFILDKLEYENEALKVMVEKVRQLIKHRPETDFNNPALCIDLLSDDVVEKLGYDFISDVLEYNSGAHSIVVRNINDPMFEEWINYINRLSIYNKKLLHFAILSYEKSKELVEELITSPVILDEEQLQNLYEVLVQRNKYEVYDIETLTNYGVHRELTLENKIERSIQVDSVKDGILEVLFNIELIDAKRIFNVYGLNSKEFISTILSDGIIDVNDQAAIEIIREIMTETDINKLRQMFKNSLDRGSIVSLVELEQKLKLYYGRQFKDSLFKADGVERPGIKYSEVSGLQDTKLTNISGREITNDDKIQVVELDGIDFKIFIHKIHNYDPKFASLASRIINDPSLWNKLEGASTLSTSMISNVHMDCVGHGSSSAVYYGFNDITEQSVMLMGRHDIYVEHGGRKLEPTSHRNEFMIPDVLQSVSTSYNEVALDRKSGNSMEFDGRIQPTCIICFDGVINDASKRAAQYFDIPIYMINKRKYSEINQSRADRYKNESLDSMTSIDVKQILCSRNGTILSRYNLFLSVVDNALAENVITSSEYIELLKEGRKIMSHFSTHNSMDNIDLSEITKRIEHAKGMGEESYDSGKRI